MERNGTERWTHAAFTIEQPPSFLAGIMTGPRRSG
jgi:hypothetical protein